MANQAETFQNRVINTTKEVAENPRIFVPLPGMIEAQEAQGKREFAKSDVLPAEMCGGEAPYLALGFVLGDPVPGDDLFRYGKLPPGWRKDEDTGHSMHTNIRDEKGRLRGSIFYKAAFYDRKASMNLQWRYALNWKDDVCDAWGVYDHREQAWLFLSTEDSKDRYQACCDWLKANVPQGSDVLADWNAP
jgi:hypothetical protein